MLPIDDAKARARLYLAPILAHAACAAALPFSSVRVDYGSFLATYFLVSILILANVAAGMLRANRARAALDALIAGGLSITPVTVATYLAIGVGMPLADDRLAAWDVAIGFDWRALVDFVDARPTLAESLSLAYRSFLFQLFIVPVWLAASGQHIRAFTTVTAFVAICFIASFVSIWFPALGAFVTYGVGPEGLVNVESKVGYVFLETFIAAHSGADFVLTDGNASGILAFPSVHAGVAIICAWAAWTSRTLWAPLLVLNGAMTFAAVTHGSHYLVDVIAGVAVAAIVIVAAKALYCRRGPSEVGEPKLALAGRHAA